MKKITGYFAGTVFDHNENPIPVKGWYTSYPEGVDHVPDVIHVSYDREGITGSVAYLKQVNGNWLSGEIINQQFQERFSEISDQIRVLAVNDFKELSDRKHTHELFIEHLGERVQFEAELFYRSSSLGYISGKRAKELSDAVYRITSPYPRFHELMGSDNFNLSAILPPVYGSYYSDPKNPVNKQRQMFLEQIHSQLSTLDHRFPER